MYWDAEAFYEKLAQGKPFTCTVDTADIACPDVTVLEIPQRYTTPQPAQHVIGYTQEGKGVAGLEPPMMQSYAAWIPSGA